MRAGAGVRLPRWGRRPTMKQFLITVTGVFVGMLLFSIASLVILFAGISALAGMGRPSPTLAQSVLTLDLRGGLTDQPSSNPLISLTAGPMSVLEIVQTLGRAEKDSDIKGLMLRLPESGMEPAAAEEIRQAILRFRKAGKIVLAHSQGLYASGPATATYMLGAAADEYWMQAGAPFEATGLATDDIFFKRAFDRYGVTADFQQREEFKNAVNPYLFADYTPAHKASQVGWMTSIYETTLARAAEGRGMKLENLRAAIEAGPYDAGLAASAGLVDRLGQPSEAEQALLTRTKAKETVAFEDYAATPDLSAAASPGAATLAVIRAEGSIVTGQGGQVSPFGGASIFSDQISEAFAEAVKDKDVKAIVFRVSSPGGVDTAADQIGAAVRAARAAGKPVVVSMGGYGASGGYWIATDADYIFAQPTTLTGSIGVYGGKFSVADAAARFGVDLRQTSIGGDFAAIGSPASGFTAAQRAAYAAQIDRTYARFIERVAQGRRMPPERVRELARGRVWTGADAKGVGLIDELGGFHEAVEKAKALAKITGEVRLKVMPRELGFFEAMEQALGVSATSARTLAAAAWVMGDPTADAALDEMARARLMSRGANVLAPTPLRQAVGGP